MLRRTTISFYITILGSTSPRKCVYANFSSLKVVKNEAKNREKLLIFYIP